MNQPKLTLGSLFDGIGGFCLAGQMAGIKPIWASEIEPFPIRVTEKRFPDVRQLGDIHALHGEDVPPVDIITFGSPCQNLSIAGKRTGLDGEQSSLFYEAVRIIKEMRRSTHGQYPRWAVWENVPGALSSNDGHDFRAVLQSLAEIADEPADVPMPADGKWLGAGEIVGNHYSLAWRILDASKGWGVAQRRRRIFAVLDLAGACAGQVLFESEGLARDYKDPPIISPTAEYLVRRLAPDECCRLQGYPDGWCAGLDSEAPSEAEVSRWREIFAVWDGIQGKSRPRTDNQIIKWLRHPNTDAAEYKAYGNSVAVPCVFFVLAGIAWAAGKEQSE